MSFNQWFRKHQKVFYVVLGVIIMVTWYMASSIQQVLASRMRTGKGAIYGKSVSQAEVQNVAHALQVVFRQKNQTTTQTLAQAWQYLILSEEARELGIRVSEPEVDKFLSEQFPSGTGGVNLSAYRDYLRASQISAAQFEDTLREVMSISKLYKQLDESVKMSEDEAWHLHAHDNQKVKVQYAELLAESLKGLVSITEQEAKEFHQARMNKFTEEDPYGAAYQIHEKVKMDYLIAPYDKFTKDVVVTENQVKKYYDENKETRFKEAKLPTSGNAGANKEEEPTYVPIDMARPTIVSALRTEESHALAQAEIDRVYKVIAKEIETPFGSTERKPFDMQEVGKQFPNVEYGITTELFSKDDIPNEFVGSADLETYAFNQSVEAIKRLQGPITCQRGAFVFELLEIQGAHASAFSDVRAKVEDDLKLKKARELAETTLRDVLKEQEGGKSISFEKAVEGIETRLAALAPKSAVAAPKETPNDAAKDATKDAAKEAAAAKTKYVLTGVTDFISKSSMYLALADKTPAQRPDFIREAMQLTEGKLGMATDKVEEGVSCLLNVIATQYPNKSEFEAEKDALMRMELARKRQESKQAWVDEVKKRAKPSEQVRGLLATLPYWGKGETAASADNVPMEPLDNNVPDDY